jgi:hypothetical protein
MFVGHFGVGLAGKAVSPRVSLGSWFFAVQFADLLWPILLLLGWEHVGIVPGSTRLTPFDFSDYPISHSLVADLGWGVALALVAYFFRARWDGDRGRRLRTALLLGAGVVSHWVLDVLVHRRDVPVLPNGPYLGLGLWNHPALELPLEMALFVAGTVLYLRATRARDRIGSVGLWALLIFLTVAWLLPVCGPPPPSVRAVAWGGTSMWLLVLWGWWVDRHRQPRGATPAGG